MESQHANWTDPMINGWFTEQQIEGRVRFHLQESSFAKPQFWNRFMICMDKSTFHNKFMRQGFEAFDIPPNSMQLLSLSITDDQNLQKMNEGQLDLADLPFSTIQTRAVSQFLRCLSMSITNN